MHTLPALSLLFGTLAFAGLCGRDRRERRQRPRRRGYQEEEEGPEGTAVQAAAGKDGADNIQQGKPSMQIVDWRHPYRNCKMPLLCRSSRSISRLGSLAVPRFRPRTTPGPISPTLGSFGARTFSRPTSRTRRRRRRTLAKRTL